MTSLTFYGGVNEVGGNKILLKDGDMKIFLDFGMSFALKSKYYSAPFLSPRSEKALLEFGLLPRVEGIYKFDESERGIDAVFLSHSHIDHSAYISFLKRSIPIYCGETTATILKTLDETRMSGFEFDLEGIEFKTFRTGNKIEIGGLEIEPIHVDHSVPGAYGLIVYTSSGPIVYTGDLRMHGTKPEMTEDFIQKCKDEKPLGMISEATNMTGAEISSEPEIRGKIEALVRQTKGLVLADFARADVDRLRTFYQVAKNSGRYLALTLKQAYFLNKLGEDPHLEIPKLSDENILIFQKSKKKYYTWEQEMLTFDNVVDTSKVADMQEEVILVTSFYDLEELIDIKPVPESCYIFSASEPFNEEMEIDFDKLINWLKHYGLPQYRAHVSGHIMPLELKEVIKEVNPRMVFPIHTEHPDLFHKFMRGIKSEISVVEKGKEYII